MQQRLSQYGFGELHRSLHGCLLRDELDVVLLQPGCARCLSETPTADQLSIDVDYYKVVALLVDRWSPRSSSEASINNESFLFLPSSVYCVTLRKMLAKYRLNNFPVIFSIIERLKLGLKNYRHDQAHSNEN